MRPADRLFRIIQLMRATGRAMTAAEIAEKMEVSRRTIYRDMEHLVGSGAPIDGEPGVGYLLREDFDAPPLVFTFEQLEALAFGVRAVQMLGDDSLGRAAREALEKLEASLPKEHVERLRRAPLRAFRSGSQGTIPASFDLVRKAISAHRKMEIGYRSLSGAVTRRVVRPLGLSAFGNLWLLTAWCELRDGFRDFRLDRVEDAILLDETFPADEEKSFERYLDGVAG